MGRTENNAKEATLMDYIVNFILQGQASFTPEVLLRFFFVVLLLREIFGILNTLVDTCRRL